MRPITYVRAGTAEAARSVVRASAREPAEYLAGGTTLIDLMKLDVLRPGTLVDIKSLDESRLRAIEIGNDTVRLGAMSRMAEAAEHPGLRERVPMLTQSLLLAASPQIRNMARLGGNVLQRTRCPYFRDVTYAACNKRRPGSGCAALDGVNRRLAVLGGSEHCIATYPGDFAQALVALDAEVELDGDSGPRRIPFARLHRLPGDRPDLETTLRPGEVILGFRFALPAWIRRSLYLKIRDRDSYEFALASAAVALDLDGDIVRQARIALGGVATVPWRAAGAEAALTGRKAEESVFAAAAEGAFSGAMPRRHNGFKVALGRETLVRALSAAAAMKVPT